MSPERPAIRSQLNVLFERDVAVLWGSPGRLLVLLIHPPLIGALVGLAWVALGRAP